MMDTMTPTRPNSAQQFTYEDLRDWIERADQLGELRRVDGASWEKNLLERMPSERKCRLEEGASWKSLPSG